jgi:hypothetical protein
MSKSDDLSARRAALRAAIEALPAVEGLPESVGRVPITTEQWIRGSTDVDLDGLRARYLKSRLWFLSILKQSDHDLTRQLRPAAINLASVAQEACEGLQVLATFDPGSTDHPKVADHWRRLLAEDAKGLLAAAISQVEPPSLPHWPPFPDVEDDGSRDVLMIMFGIPVDELTDDQGAFCDSRVLAHFRLRLSELQQRCDPIMKLVAERPPSVFTAVSAVRDLATSASPWMTLLGAREVRLCILKSFDSDPSFTRRVLADAAKEGDQEWMSFDRLQSCIRRAEATRKGSRDFAVATLEAYRHMAEGITRRWVQTLLRLSGLSNPPQTVGAMTEPAVAHLGRLGRQVEGALIPMLRNAEAHDDFSFDENTGSLVLGDLTVDPDEIVPRLRELDVLARAFIIGRLAAFADQPKLGANIPADTSVHSSASSALVFARQRFGHAGQRVRRFVRDRDRLDIAVDGLKAESCNPCFVALTQTAQVLPTITRFTVEVAGRDSPVIDLPSSVLHENWRTFLLACEWFPDALPPETFLPSLAWCRLACESMEDATRASAWWALNDAGHAINDAYANSMERQRLSARFALVAAAISSTIRVMPEESQSGVLAKVQRLIRAIGDVHSRDPYGVAMGVLRERIFSFHDELGGPFAVLPTLDPAPPPQEGSFPHAVS